MKVQTEQTDKTWKAIRFFSVIAILIGFIMLFSPTFNIGMAVLAIGGAGYISSRLCAWWDNG